jgi:hypothetical protein
LSPAESGICTIQLSLADQNAWIRLTSESSE